MATSADSVWEYLAIAFGIVLVAFVSWLVLRSARRIVAVLGETGMTALVRVMGFLLVCVGVQFIGLGVIQIVANPEFLRAVVEALAQVEQG
jgi:multiple antibiotic resistance protein